jgi:hypothetical protein
MVAATRAAASGASAVGQRAAHGAGVLLGGASNGAQKGAGPISTVLGAGKRAAGAASRSAIERFKARLSRAVGPFRESVRAGAEKSAEGPPNDPPKT